MAEEPRALTREFLLSGELPVLIAKLLPGVRVLSDAERAASLHATLAARPEHGDGVWMFAYGSLIWNPTIHYRARRLARAVGWHRSFCLSVKAGRGTHENPGLMLGLQPGGDCTGVAFRIEEAVVEQELDVLWRREMVAEGYVPRWVTIDDTEGREIGGAIAFTINPAGPSYCGELPEAEVVRRLATARGGLGSGAEYLFNTRDGLRSLGIRDPFVERLAELVTAEMKPAS
jgi:glutathione-specific gamma-glutamylcyclotransferase